MRKDKENRERKGEKREERKKVCVRERKG